MRLLVALSGAAGLCLLFSGLKGRQTGHTRRRPRGRVPVRRLAASAFLFVACTLVIAGVTRLPVLALLAGCSAASAPFLVHASRQSRRARASRAKWPELIQDLVSIIRSGASLPEAWIRLSEREFPGVSEHLVASNLVYRSSGSFVMCLDDARERLDDPVADHVLVALKVAYEVGGTDLVPALRTLADAVAADLATRQEVEARWSWTVSSARVAAVAPWVVLLLMLSRPETMRAYSSLGGAGVLLFAAFTTICGYLLMLRAARLPEHRG